LGGVLVRAGPSVAAPPTGVRLAQNDIIAISDEIPSSDGRVYLRLADGTGWAFDDSFIMPHDPSCVRVHWSPDVIRQLRGSPSQTLVPHVLSTAPVSPTEVSASTTEKKKKRRKRKSHRRKRGAGGSRAAIADEDEVSPGADDDSSDADNSATGLVTRPSS